MSLSPNTLQITATTQKMKRIRTAEPKHQMAAILTSTPDAAWSADSAHERQSTDQGTP